MRKQIEEKFAAFFFYFHNVIFHGGSCNCSLFLYLKSNIMKVDQFEDDLTPQPSGYFGYSPGIVRHDQSIPEFAKTLYSELSALTNQTGYCWASNAYLGKVLGKDKLTVSRTLSILEEKGYISIIHDRDNGNKRFIFCEADAAIKRRFMQNREVFRGIDKKINRGIDENVNRGIDENVNRGIDENVNHNTIIYKNNNNTVDFEKVDCDLLEVLTIANIKKEVSAPPQRIAKTKKEVEAPATIAKTTKEKTDDAPAIIALLNEITGRSFRASDSSLRPIRARLREGFTMDDFSAVIRLKNAQWANRADMRQYLRPETLFGNKFDGYIQEAKALHATKIPVVEGETDEYRKYVRWAETYFTYLGANLVLDERTFTDITKGKAFDNHRCLLPKNTLSALFKEAHRICNEQMGRTGTCKGVKATYIELINQNIK